ncbi:MAG: hypothetical protein ACE5EU_00805 [Paracoccaceae bacterium]
MISRHFTRLSLAALLAAAAGLIATQASAAELVWRFQSEHPNWVSLEFYSQDRNHVWPGGGDVYVIKDWDTHRYSLSCNYGETICFGAWVRNDSNTYWGAGYDGVEACDACCAVCGYGDINTQVLKP